MALFPASRRLGQRELYHRWISICIGADDNASSVHLVAPSSRRLRRLRELVYGRVLVLATGQLGGQSQRAAVRRAEDLPQGCPLLPGTNTRRVRSRELLEHTGNHTPQTHVSLPPLDLYGVRKRACAMYCTGGSRLSRWFFANECGKDGFPVGEG